MQLQTQLVVCTLILALLGWILRTFARHQLSSGQTLFWALALVGGLVLTLAPPLVGLLSKLWGDLWPVSWISFLAILALIAFLLYQSTLINAQNRRLTQLARQTAFLERRLRSTQTDES